MTHPTEAIEPMLQIDSDAMTLGAALAAAVALALFPEEMKVSPLPPDDIEKRPLHEQAEILRDLIEEHEVDINHYRRWLSRVENKIALEERSFPRVIEEPEHA